MSEKPQSDPPEELPASDPTEDQSAAGQAAARRLSLQSTVPPADVPGVRLQSFLGSGAFGQVWVGKDLNTGRGVAVKFYLHRGGVNWSLLSREVKNLVQLSTNRHVVQVLEVGWEADPPYYIMELIEGGSLEEMLVRRGRLPVNEAVELFEKICLGLNHCHGKGVLHCDIKPANVLLAADNEPRLADFGQSRMSHDQTPAMGTLFYMAPEQADLESTPDARWDVYAAGALLYRMLAGNAPHRDQSLLSQLDTAGSLPGRLERYREAIANAPNPIDSLKRPGLDRMLKSILQRTLAVDPKERYGNVQQIMDDLHSRRVTHAKRPLMLLGIVGPLLLLLATCVFAYRSINRATRSATEALRTEAFGSNQLAARFAAQTLETEIERYFDLVQDEANRKSFRTLLSDTFTDPIVREALEEIRQAGTAEAARSLELESTAESAGARDRLLDSDAYARLNDYLSERFSLYLSGNQATGRRQRLASMFVTDASGTISAIAYGNPVSRNLNSAGRNFAYRTYFHGDDDDLSLKTAIKDVAPLMRTHLSAAFQSTATGLWKVAVSTPIRLADTSNLSDAEPPPADGVMVLTINLGDFQLLQSSRGASQVAVLLEARPGPLRGTVLQHPLMDELRASGKNLSEDRYQVAPEVLENLLQGGDVNYRDPMASGSVPAKASERNADSEATSRNASPAIEKQKNENASQQYAGQWIAAMQPVTLPEIRDDQPGKRTTDLLVLVQYRLSEVLGPVGELRRSLFREGIASVLSILIVTLTLWWLVRRVGNIRGNESESTTDDQTPPENQPTMTLDS